MIVTLLKFRTEHNEYPFDFFPRVVQWANYIRAVTWIDFVRYLRNSITVAAISVGLYTFSSALVGYGFARLHAPGKNFLFMLLLSTLMPPYMVTVIPTYILFNRLGLVNSYWLWVFWGLSGSPFMIFLYRQFFAGIPKEIEEAATIDGCNWFRTSTGSPAALRPGYRRRGYPRLPVGLERFHHAHDLSHRSVATLTIKLALGYIDPQGNKWPPLQCAGALFYTLPVIVFFFAAQKQIIQGVVTTGIKDDSRGSSWKGRIFRPGAVWTDTEGSRIEAHGGGILREGKSIFVRRA